MQPTRLYLVRHGQVEGYQEKRYNGQRNVSLTEIGEVTSEQLDIIPARIRVIRHIRKQYACRCGHCIRTAALPPQPIPKSLASPGLLAHITVSKYQDALPLYRQEAILRRIGVDLPRATLANWMIQAGSLIQPLINLLRDRLLAYDILQMDETPVQVLKEPDRAAQSKSYLWLQRGGPPDRPVVLLDYDPGRGAEVPKRLLADFKGYLQTDGYDGYNAVVAKNKLTPVGCMAHARRKFSDAVKAQGMQRALDYMALEAGTPITGIAVVKGVIGGCTKFGIDDRPCPDALAVFRGSAGTDPVLAQRFHRDRVPGGLADGDTFPESGPGRGCRSRSARCARRDSPRRRR